MSTTQVLVPVQEIPRIPVHAAQVLQRYFEISLSEWALLFECQHREDLMKFGLFNHHVTALQRPHLYSLRDKGCIRYSAYTGKWEPTEWGVSILLNAPLIAQGLVSQNDKLADVLEFPIRQSGNSA